MTLRFCNGSGPGSVMGPSFLEQPFKFSTYPSLEILPDTYQRQYFSLIIAVDKPEQPWNSNNTLAIRRYHLKDESVTFDPKDLSRLIMHLGDHA